jgi:DNA ligase (NAD+)
MNINKMTVPQLEAEIRKHDHLYWVNKKPSISDQEYDLLKRRLEELCPTSPLLAEVADDDLDTATFGEPVKHEIPMLSMNKVYDSTNLTKWAKGLGCNEFISSPKMDGCALSLIYIDGVLVEGSTRGKNNVGDNVTENVKQIKNIPQKIKLSGKIEVRGEAIMPLSVFERYKDVNSNARNLVAGSIKQKDPRETGKRDLKFYAYNIYGTNAKTEQEKYKILEDNGFTHVEAKYCIVDKFKELFEYFQKNRATYDFELDGVIFVCNDLNLHEKLGATSHHPRYAMAWKFQGESATTEVTDVIWNISRTGTITPVALVKPVKLSGATVSKITMHNLKFFKALNIGKGDVIEASRRGEVIPQIERVVNYINNDKFDIPGEINGHAVFQDGDFLRLVDPNECSAVSVNKINHFVKVTEIEGLGDKNIQKLFDVGLIKNFVDLYKLTKDDMTGIAGLGDKIASNIMDQINNKRTLSLDVFLRSLGIDDLGNKISKVLSETFESIDRVRSIQESDLSIMNGIGDKIAKNVIKGLSDMKDQIDGLLEYVDVQSTMKKTGPLVGKTFVFTGTMTIMGRTEAQKKVAGLGGDTPSGVNKELTYLVCADDGQTSSKLIKAKKLIDSGSKIQIISEQEFIDLIK